MPKPFFVFCLVLVSGCQILNGTINPLAPSEPSQLSDLKGSALAVAFSPDGATLAVSEGTPPGAVSLWSVSSGRRLKTIRDTGVVDTLAYSPDGICVSTLGTRVFWRGDCPPLIIQFMRSGRLGQEGQSTLFRAGRWTALPRSPIPRRPDAGSGQSQWTGHVVERHHTAGTTGPQGVRHRPRPRVLGGRQVTGDGWWRQNRTTVGHHYRRKSRRATGA